MALAIDAANSPPVVTNAVGGTATVTTASFTPPAGSLLLVLWSGNSSSGANPAAPTITDNLGVHLTYTQTDWQSHANAPTVNGQAAAWWAVVGSSAAMTVTVTNGDTTNHQAALAVVVLTGQHATPVGAHGKSGSASAASIAQSYTAQATGGWGFLVSCDWDALGTDTAGTGCTLLPSGSGTIPTTQISYAFERRTSADDSNGVSNTLNLTIAGTSTNLSWVYVEVVPAAGSSFDAQVSVTRQQSSVTRVGPVVVAPTIGPPQVIQLPQITVVRHVKQPPAPFPIAVNPPLLPAQAQPVAPIVVVPQARLAQPPTISVSQPQMPAAVAGILPSAPVWVNPSQTQPSLAAVTSITPPPLPQPPAPITVIPSRSQPPLSATITLTPPPLPQAAAPIVVVTSTWQPRQPQIVIAQPQLPAPVAAILPAAPILVAAVFVRPGFLPAAVSPPQFLGPAAPDLAVAGTIATTTTIPRLASATAGSTLTDSTGASQLGNSSTGPQIAPTTSGGDT